VLTKAKEKTAVLETLLKTTDQTLCNIIERKGSTMKIRNILLTAFTILGLVLLTMPATQAQTQAKAQNQDQDQAQIKAQVKAQTHTEAQVKAETKAQNQDQAQIKAQVKAQVQVCDGSGKNFVDLDGDGFNDNAPDHDADGIPNGLDPEYIKGAQDGTGYQNGSLGENKGEGMAQNKTMTKSQKFSRIQTQSGSMFQKRLGAQGGMNGSGTGICDGTGDGGSGTGICDGTGPKGTQNRGGKK
jgi:hypothetical protein